MSGYTRQGYRGSVVEAAIQNPTHGLRRSSKKKFTLLARTAVGKKAEGKTVRVWFQDEARVGQQGTTTRMWVLKGTRPRALQQQEFESAFVYGSVCPATGASESPYTIDTFSLRTRISFKENGFGWL